MILCAALEISSPDFKPSGKLVIPCWRHAFGYSILYDLVGHKYPAKDIVEGFLTTDNLFLDRTDAFDHAFECGQLSATTRQTKLDNREIELYSEDLY